MQTSCPHCRQVIAVDDSSVPQGPFMLKCPRCQGTLKVETGSHPQTFVATRQGPATERMVLPSPTPPPPAPPRGASVSSPPAPPGKGNEAGSSSAHRTTLRALLGPGDEEQTRLMKGVLEQRGHGVDAMDSWEQRAVELQQGLYDLVVAHRNGSSSGAERDLLHLVNSLPAERRARIFVVVLGEDFKTGNAADAFAALADFVCHPRDVTAALDLLESTMAEKARLYRAYLDILRRKEAGDL